MNTLGQDLRYATRMLVKSPGFTIAALLTLAIGIGANTALFSVVKTVLLQKLPYAQPERLVFLAAGGRTTLIPENVSYGLVMDWKQRSHSFSSIAMFRGWTGTLTGKGRPQVLRGMRVSHDLFETLGVSPELGRGFTREEDRPDRWHVVMLSHGLWRETFGGRPDVIGQTILLNQIPYQIVGVLPEDFHPAFSRFVRAPQIFAPLGYDASLSYACRSCQHLLSVARLRDGVTVEVSRAELNGIAKQLAREFPNDYAPDHSAFVLPLQDRVVGSVRGPLWLLLGATAFVLLIACVNVANLLLSRAAVRQREMAVRAALGASPLRLARQHLTETMILTLLGGVGGIFLAQWIVAAFVKWAPSGIPRLADIHVDAAVLAFTLAVSILTGLMAGLVPALQAARIGRREILQSGGRGAAGLARNRLRSALVVSEIALAFVLAVGTGLLVKSLFRVLGESAGFEPRNLYQVDFGLIGPKYEKDEAVVRFEREALERIAKLPGVEHAAIVSTLPLNAGYDRRSLFIEDRPLSTGGEAPSLDTYYVSPDYFLAMGISLRRGRLFAEADAAPSAAPVAVISESTARQVWPGEDPLGKRIQLGEHNDKKPWSTIVGIVGDVRQYGLDSAPTADGYLLYTQQPFNYPTLVVRSALPSVALARAIEEQIAALDKDVPLTGAGMMTDVLSRSVSQRRFVASLIASFCVLALGLSGIGIFAVMAYQVSQRTNEIGVRMALGAQVGDVLALVAGLCAKLLVAGILVGWGGAAMLGRVISGQLYGVSAFDPLTIIGVTFVMALAGLAACYIPARRATRVDPLVALRYE